jgi:hypothetical protein
VISPHPRRLGAALWIDSHIQVQVPKSHFTWQRSVVSAGVVAAYLATLYLYSVHFLSAMVNHKTHTPTQPHDPYLSRCTEAMPCTRRSRTPTAGESRREEQFYQYYGPFKQMSKYGPRFCNVKDSQSQASHKPVSCPDKTLTAFCQLGALRMQARRCLIFFFDINYAYSMAEATRSLSLEDDQSYEPGDQLWRESPLRNARMN